MFEMSWWYQFLVTSANIAFLVILWFSVFCEEWVWNDNVLSNVLRGICDGVGLPMCLTVCAICIVLSIIPFFFFLFLNGEPGFWLVLCKFETQVEVMLCRIGDKEGMTSTWQLMEDYVGSYRNIYILMFLCFSWVQEGPKLIGKGGSLTLFLLHVGRSCREVKSRLISIKEDF